MEGVRPSWGLGVASPMAELSMVCSPGHGVHEWIYDVNILCEENSIFETSKQK